jgi:hypothetical protein
MNLERFDRILKTRVVAACVCFAVFVAVSIHALATETLSSQPTPPIVMMVLTYVLIPRRALPKDYKPLNDSEVALVEVRDRLSRKLQMARLFFFFAAVVLLALVPFLMGEPIFRTT